MNRKRMWKIRKETMAQIGGTFRYKPKKELVLGDVADLVGGGTIG